MMLALTLLNVAFKSATLLIVSAATTFLSTTKFSVAATFLSTTAKLNAATFLTTTAYLRQELATESFANHVATTFLATTGSAKISAPHALLHVPLLALLPVHN
jgi:hypothetical protein